MLHEFCGFGKHIKPGSPPWISAAGEHSLAVKRPLLPEQKDQSVLDLLAVSRACFWWVLRATHTLMDLTHAKTWLCYWRTFHKPNKCSIFLPGHTFSFIQYKTSCALLSKRQLGTQWGCGVTAGIWKTQWESILGLDKFNLLFTSRLGYPLVKLLTSSEIKHIRTSLWCMEWFGVYDMLLEQCGLFGLGLLDMVSVLLHWRSTWILNHHHPRLQCEHVLMLWGLPFPFSVLLLVLCITPGT